VEETRAEVQVLRTTALAHVNNLSLIRDAIDGDCNHLKAMRTSSPRWSVECDNKVTVNILFTAGTHPYGIVRELPRRSFLYGLETIVPRRPPGERVRGHDGSGESNCTSGENQESGIK